MTEVSKTICTPAGTSVSPNSIEAAQSSGSVAEDVLDIELAKQVTEVSKTICTPAGTAVSPNSIEAAQSSGSVAEDVLDTEQAKQVTEVYKTICTPTGTSVSPNSIEAAQSSGSVAEDVLDIELAKQVTEVYKTIFTPAGTAVSPKRNEAAQSSGSVAEDVAAIAQAKQVNEVSKTICNPAGTAVSQTPREPTSPMLLSAGHQAVSRTDEDSFLATLQPATSSSPSQTGYGSLRDFFQTGQLDIDSDVLSLGDCTKVPDSTPLFTDPPERPEAATGESCFTVLHQSQQHHTRFEDFGTNNEETDLSDTGNTQGNTVLNSIDPFPNLRRLSGPSRSLLKSYFDKNVPVILSKDHKTVAFSEDQVYNLIRVACDETAHASFEMMSGLLQRASRLPARAPARPDRTERPQSNRFRASTPMPSMTGTSVASDVCPLSSDSEVQSHTSGAIQTGDSDISLHASTAGHRIVRQSASSPDFDAAELSDNSQDRSLASFRKEALNEFTHGGKGRKCTRSIVVGDPPPKKSRMSRPDKIFKESYFRKIEWSRIFVSGPMNPLKNPHCFFCQICRRNVSIYGKAAAEVKRHYSSREHFRKDQKWRYTHLSRTDPVSQIVTHFVRDKKGNLLSSFELELELPNFIDEELVEIGDKLPFYEDFKASRESITPNRSRDFTQLCLIGDYLKGAGDIASLQRIWTNVGTFTNHQSMFADFDWSEERMTVSMSVYLCHCNSLLLISAENGGGEKILIYVEFFPKFCQNSISVFCQFLHSLH